MVKEKTAPFPLILASNVKSVGSEKKNTIASYRVQLDSAVRLNGGEWEVGLTEVFYPGTWDNISKYNQKLHYYLNINILSSKMTHEVREVFRYFPKEIIFKGATSLVAVNDPYDVDNVTYSLAAVIAEEKINRKRDLEGKEEEEEEEEEKNKRSRRGDGSEEVDEQLAAADKEKQQKNAEYLLKMNEKRLQFEFSLLGSNGLSYVPRKVHYKSVSANDPNLMEVIMINREINIATGSYDTKELIKTINATIADDVKNWSDNLRLLLNLRPDNDVDGLGVTFKDEFPSINANVLRFYYNEPKNRVYYVSKGGASGLMPSSPLGNYLGFDSGGETIVSLSGGAEKRVEARYPLQLNMGRNMYLYSDVVLPQNVNDTTAQVLRMLPVNSTPAGRLNHLRYSPPEYRPVSSSVIESVHIEFRDSVGRIFPFNGGASAVSLHFRRRQDV